MGLNEIKSLQELLEYLPLLVKLHRDLNGYWAANMTSAEFVAELTNRFQKDSYYFGIKNGDDLYYFIAVDRINSTKACFWLFYMAKDKRAHTKNLLDSLRAEFKHKGYKTAEFSSPRITRSYDRWVTKFGATKSHITYSLIL